MKCTTREYSYRHPRKCKFGTDCSFLHVTTEDEVVKIIKNVEKEVHDLRSEILTLKTINFDLQSSLNAIKEELKAKEKLEINETDKNSVPLLSCELCDFEFISEEMLKQHHSSDLCDYESKSKKGVKIHRGAKHKSVQPLPTSTLSSSPLSQTPINCILKDDGCPNFLPGKETRILPFLS